jgi:UDP-N-acetylglucosamine 2-epimerase (non-hydrolysing)
MACALAAAKLEIPVAHVEAGLRSFDRSMPEEINRIVTDAISDCLLVSERSGLENLRREGRPEECLHLTGNVMIDTLKEHLPRAKALGTPASLGVEPHRYGVVTLHRPANVDSPNSLGPLLTELAAISSRLPLVFPVHPRTQARFDQFGFGPLFARTPGLVRTPPLGYLPFLSLTAQARVVVTDSGGLQEESTALGVPCITLRPTTERPSTVEEGTSTLVGSDTALLRRCLEQVLDGTYKRGNCPRLWDGNAATRIAAVLATA